jgi:hypothetical protein
MLLENTCRRRHRELMFGSLNLTLGLILSHLVLSFEALIFVSTFT